MKTSLLLVLVLVLTGCGGNVAEPMLQDAPPSDASSDASSSDDDRPYIGGPCAFTYEDGCEIRTCLDGSGKVERITRTPIGDAGTCPDV